MCPITASGTQRGGWDLGSTRVKSTRRNIRPKRVWIVPVVIWTKASSRRTRTEAVKVRYTRYVCRLYDNLGQQFYVLGIACLHCLSSVRNEHIQLWFSLNFHKYAPARRRDAEKFCTIMCARPRRAVSVSRISTPDGFDEFFFRSLVRPKKTDGVRSF